MRIGLLEIANLRGEIEEITIAPPPVRDPARVSHLPALIDGFGITSQQWLAGFLEDSHKDDLLAP
jgi:hypothetical protein